MKDIQRYKIIQDVTQKRMTGLQAAEILNLTNVQICTIQRKYGITENGNEDIKYIFTISCRFFLLQFMQ